ncbi:hypothetical protein Q428_04655 [Fervidicella metallireducens AeB]|uniref:Uncharacterized protein n=1 Tax=Fervidicella metallireducens AeB TaxID=1403537 RepID=A0A017RWR7_9CLOT|nr:DUF6076 domain-containing protein [Fervidicella metallireducens]EYE89102.1 hypothetical protein Q428_04655 [Fervidicella metallireducens AeB]
MAVTIEFDDTRLTERINEPFKGIDETNSLGMSFVDFLSLGKDLSSRNHIYFYLFDNFDRYINEDSFLYSGIKEFIDICIKDSSLYTLDNFMFFLHMQGLSIPQHHIEYYFNTETVLEDLVNPYMQMSPMERAIRGFTKCDKSKNAITNVYTCDSIEDICIASLYHLIKLKTPIKICANCGKYFVALRRSDAIYCDRISPFNAAKTCKEDGSQRTFEEKLKMNEAEKLRRSVYQTLQMRIRRNPDDEYHKEYFENWKKEVDKWKNDIKKGKKTTEEFIEWLNWSKMR